MVQITKQGEFISSVNKLLLAIAAIFSLVILSGCGSTDFGEDEFTSNTLPDPVSTQPQVSMRLGGGDLLDIEVFGVEEFSGEFRLDDEGYLKYPLIGLVEASGKSSTELALDIEERLRTGNYLVDPSVIVRVVESVSQRLTVDGSVEKPGFYSLSGNTTLLQAVAMAGGPSENANAKQVAVFRQINGQRAVATFNLADIRKGQAEDPLVYAGDIVVVDGSRTKASYREIIRAVPAFAVFRYF